jgi:hypothetical protein
MKHTQDTCKIRINQIEKTGGGGVWYPTTYISYIPDPMFVVFNHAPFHSIFDSFKKKNVWFLS